MLKERERQDQKWGEQNHSPIEWCAILGEEVGEVNRTVLETHFEYDGKDDYTEYRTELIQVAAVAIAMIESYDRNRQ
ncbi:MazG-like family protein [Leptospira santarosai]|nr:MazG-like family protein [Leptospira santarosai]MDI7190880.1 MazG-like family protein [Leptospira santarosai]